MLIMFLYFYIKFVNISDIITIFNKISLVENYFVLYVKKIFRLYTNTKSKYYSILSYKIRLV